MGDEAEVSKLRVEADEGGEEGDCGDQKEGHAERGWRHAEEDGGGEGAGRENEESEVEAGKKEACEGASASSELRR